MDKLEKIKELVSDCEQCTRYFNNVKNIQFYEQSTYQEIRDLLGLKVEKGGVKPPTI